MKQLCKTDLYSVVNIKSVKIKLLNIVYIRKTGIPKFPLKCIIEHEKYFFLKKLFHTQFIHCECNSDLPVLPLIVR